MGLREYEGDMNVVEAARQRIINAAESGLPLCLSISGGKDSLCVANLCYQLLLEKKIKPEKFIVQFIDEEAIFPDCEKMVREWRLKFMELGVEFQWYCLQIRHFNCLNSLGQDDSMICWDEQKKDKWVRPMPEFAITTHPMMIPNSLAAPRVAHYQHIFRWCVNRNSISIVGLRVAESIQRLNAVATRFRHKKTLSGIDPAQPLLYPIYDWRDDDVWLYIKENKLDYPETYMYLYQVGVGKRGMRLSQFFSIDTAKSLVALQQFYPDLMDRIIKREPNAYLLSLYWDTELFRKAPKGKNKSPEEVERDYKKEVMEMLSNINENFNSEKNRSNAVMMKNFLLRNGALMLPKHWKRTYLMLYAGDPRNREYRAIVNDVFASTSTKAPGKIRKKKKQKEKESGHEKENAKDPKRRKAGAERG